jgi:tetratricopeptide (TPR) repeat protein
MPAYRALACLMALATALVGCAQETEDRSARDRLEEAIAEGDAMRAREAALALGDELPDSPEAILVVARALGEIGEMNRARWILEEALVRYPGRIDLSIGLAETSLRVADPEGALSALEGIPEERAEAAYVELLRARARIDLGHLEEGLAMLDSAHERFDHPLLFRLERIDVLVGEDRLEDALDTIREIRSDPWVPDDSQTWLAIKESDLVNGVDGPEAALALLDALWADHSSSDELAKRRTSLLVSLGRAPEALADLQRAIEAHPEAAALRVIAAQASVATGDLAAAEAHLRRHVEYEANATSLRNLALFLNQQGRAEEAAALLAERPEIADPAGRIELDYLAVALAIETGDLPAARRGIESFRRDHPSNPRLAYLLARLDLAEDRPEAAARRLTEVLPRLDRPDVKHLLGIALERSGDLAGAELRFGLAAQESSNQFSSLLGLLRTLQAQGKWERAERVALRAIRLAPAGEFPYQVLANAKIALGRAGEAEALLRDFLNASPQLVGPRVALSMVLRRQGRAEDALAVLDEAEDDTASRADLVAERAVVLGQLGRVGEGLALLEREVGDASTTRSQRHARVYLLFAAGREEDALVEAERAADLDHTDPAPDRMTADYLASHGRFGESIPAYRRALQRVDDGSLAFRLAVALERAGHDDDAIDAYRRSIDLDENAVGPRNNLALLLARGGRTREALEMAQSAYARAGTDPVVMDTLATLYLEVERAPRAVALLEKARATDGESAEIAFHLALAYRQAQRPEDARVLLHDLDARLGPHHELRDSVNEALVSLP